MDKLKLGDLISKIRKEKGLTQKQLAEKLNVTDKAISKWERNNGYPEITIIPELAKVLGVTANELLGGQLSTRKHVDINEADEIVSDTVNYIEKIKKIESSNLLVAISIIFILSTFICLMCNYLISQSFDWSLYPTGGLIVAWVIIAPLILLKRHRLLGSLIGMIISTIPYLFLIEYLCPVKGWVIPMALIITAIAFISLLGVILLFVYSRINRYYAAAITIFLYGVIVNLLVNETVSLYTKETSKDISVVITALSFALISAILVVIGLAKSKKR